MKHEPKKQMITRILKAHGIGYSILGGRIIAAETGTLSGIPHINMLDVTGWSRGRLRIWLGY